jgi:hypothetical protein
MRRRQSGLRDTLGHTFGVRDYLLLFLIGIAIAGMFGNLCYEIFHDLTDWKNLWKQWVSVSVSIVVLVVVAYLLLTKYYVPKLERERRKRLEEALRPDREQAMNFKYRGIIWLLSPDRKSLKFARHAIVTHAIAERPLEYCWVIYGTQKEKIKAELKQRFSDLKKEIEDFCGKKVKILNYEIERATAEHIFEAVTKIYREEIPKYGLNASQVISDITGGFASMSAGMMLACSLLKADVEYIEVEYDTDSQGVFPSQQEKDWKHILIEPRPTDNQKE